MRADREAPTLRPGSRLAARRSSSGRTGGRRCGWLGRDHSMPLFDGVAQTAELRRVAEQDAWILMASPLCLLKTPKAARGLEFRDSPPYCRQHVQTHAFIVAVLGRRFRSRVLQLENLALRHQLHVLRRQRPGRLRLFTIDRLLWVWLYRIWPRCLDTMMLVKPATVIQWHR
jgi:hypothetical protein